MISKPLVSIGIPTYNRAESLGRAISSLLAQNYQNIELVISNNASTDGTESVCEAAAHQDTRVKYLRQRNNIGPIANFQAVLNYSSGEFFMWLADDDWLDHDYIERCVQFLLEYPDYSLVCGRAKYFRSGKYDSQGTMATISHEKANDRILAYYKDVWDNGTFYGLMRRADLHNLGLKNTMGADWLFTAAVAFLGKIGTVEDVYINRSLGGSTVSYKKVADTLGLSRFSASYPRVSIATAAAKDILVSPVFSHTGLFGRAVLACKAFAILERRKGFYGSRSLRGIGFTILKRILPENAVLRIRAALTHRRAG
jgi:glycosyltransferase involved in cell wall biosynthesis